MITAADAATVEITFSGGEPGDVHRLSTGAPIPTDGSFKFELGGFVDGFDPALESTDTWLANWSPVTDEFGTPLPGATTDFRQVSTLFDTYPGFRSTIELTHNNAPFGASQSAYIWGYDTRTDPGAAEWVLITNLDDWKWPDTNADFSFAQLFDVGNADPADTLIGSINGEGEITLGQVTIPSAVPEPATSALTILAAAFLATRRRRPRSQR